MIQYDRQVNVIKNIVHLQYLNTGAKQWQSKLLLIKKAKKKIKRKIK